MSFWAEIALVPSLDNLNVLSIEVLSKAGNAPSGRRSVAAMLNIPIIMTVAAYGSRGSRGGGQWGVELVDEMMCRSWAGRRESVSI